MTAPARIGPRALARAGWRAVADYTGTLLALFVAQAIVAFGAGVVIAQLLAARFADRPRFDDGVDGDLLALIEALRDAGGTVLAVGWVGAGAVLLWAIASWFLAGGLIAVLAERPQGRGATARCFGAGGATHFLAFARLGVLSAMAHVVVLFVATVGLGAVYPRIERALAVGEVVGALAVGLAPAALLGLIVWTVVDHARVELVLRRSSHGVGAVGALLRATAFAFGRPLAIAHVATWAAAFWLVGAVYAWAAHGHAMLGTGGAVALLIVRQGVALVRMALKVALVGGQVELGRTRPPPPAPEPQKT